MASTPVVVFAPSGLTLTLELYPAGSDTIANGAGDTLTEFTNCKGRYVATVTEAITGDHVAVVKSGSSVIANGWVLALADTTTEQYVADAVPGTRAAIADAVWDEVITGAEHNIQTSAARFLRESAEATAGVTGTLQSATSTTAVLASGAVPANDYYNGERLTIIEGTGLGQSRLITGSTASSDTVTVGHAWITTPDATSIYAIVGAEADVRAIAEQPVTATGTVDFDSLGASSAPQLLQNTTIATLASQTSFTLTAGSADDDAYNGAMVVVTDSATSAQKAVGVVSDYTGSSKTVTLSADPGVFIMAVGDTVDVVATVGAAVVTVAPLAGTVQSRVSGTSIEVFTEETTTVAVAAVDATGAAVDVSAMTLELTIENEYGVDVAVIADGGITKASSTFSFAVPSAVSASEGQYRWAVRQTGDDGVLMQGPFVVTYAPGAD